MHGQGVELATFEMHRCELTYFWTFVQGRNAISIPNASNAIVTNLEEIFTFYQNVYSSTGFKSRRDDTAKKKMVWGKSPAQEWLRMDFYQFFWDDIRELLFEALEKVYGNTLVTTKQGVITLKPKPNRDRAIIDHLRSFKVHWPVDLRLWIISYDFFYTVNVIKFWEY